MFLFFSGLLYIDSDSGPIQATLYWAVWNCRMSIFGLCCHVFSFVQRGNMFNRKIITMCSMWRIWPIYIYVYIYVTHTYTSIFIFVIVVVLPFSLVFFICVWALWVKIEDPGHWVIIFAASSSQRGQISPSRRLLKLHQTWQQARFVSSLGGKRHG